MSDRDALAAMIESGIRLEAFPGIIADHILRSDWLAEHDAQVRAEALKEAISECADLLDHSGDTRWFKRMNDIADRIARAEPTDSEVE